ncbi:MAG TPA: GNAT family N-acetyltransferase [Puia sp.]|nr:GNAT family N-acetyltransferase [Puia sp.]
MKMAVKIRTAKNHDAKKIFQFLCEKEEKLFDKELFENNYRTCIGDPDNVYLVAAGENNEPLGFISAHGGIELHEEGMVYQIQEFFVEKKCRKGGVGRLLLKELDALLVKKECRLISVSISNYNSRTINFFIKNGFAHSHVALKKRNT